MYAGVAVPGIRTAAFVHDCPGIGAVADELDIAAFDVYGFGDLGVYGSGLALDYLDIIDGEIVARGMHAGILGVFPGERVGAGTDVPDEFLPIVVTSAVGEPSVAVYREYALVIRGGAALAPCLELELDSLIGAYLDGRGDNRGR